MAIAAIVELTLHDMQGAMRNRLSSDVEMEIDLYKVQLKKIKKLLIPKGKFQFFFSPGSGSKQASTTCKSLSFAKSTTK